MTIEKFIIRITCILCVLTILLIDAHQYKKLQKFEKSITNMQKFIYLDWKLRKHEKLQIPPVPELDLHIVDPNEQHVKYKLEIEDE